jgi:Zn-dependent M16 (insulinase) family peptidase
MRMSVAVLPGETLYGFRIVRRRPLPGLRAEAVEARHGTTGARVLNLAVPDAENLFAVAFLTPPPDNSGVPHILEHVTLGGSQRFPVKDPFAEMLKSSMATFLNALTCSDRTLYPVASNVVHDFFNLAEVYLDAVFRPRLSHDTFMQEGWHWTATPTRTGSLRPTLRGVVFNEMSGAFSDLDALVERETLARLFPMGTYGLDAGGEPEAMPDLSHAACREYHGRCYHPAAARFFLYGDIPLAEKLRFLGARLDGLPPRPFQPPVLVRQAPWLRPRRAAVWLGGRPDDDQACGTAATLSWVLGDLQDPELDLGWELLDRLLLGDDAAPLRRHLMESGIGDDLTASGYLSDSLQTVFQVGLKGGRSMPLERFEPTVLRLLQAVAAEGFPSQRIDDAFRQIEYSRRDIDSGFPVHLMEDVFAVWLYGLDPLAFLAVDSVIERLRGRIARDPGLPARWLRRHLLENPHRLTLTLAPRPRHPSDRQRRLSQRVRRFGRSVSAADVDRLHRQAEAMEERQGRPNLPEALATLPYLQRDDLPEEPAAIRSVLETLPSGTHVLRNDVPSNGLTYVALAFDLTGLPAELWTCVPAYSALLTRLGAGRLDYAELSAAITRNTGGLVGGVQISPSAECSGQARPFLVLQTRTLDETCEQAMQLLTAIVDDLRIVPDQRLREALVQRRAGMLAGVVAQGHHLAALEAGQDLDTYHWLSNLWKGPPQVQLAHAMAEGTPASLQAAADALLRLQVWLRGSPAAFASCTGTDRGHAALRTWLDARLRPSAPAAPAPAGPEKPAPRPAAIVGLSHPLDTAFCACVLPAPRWDSAAAPGLQIAAQILSYDYFWEEVRIRGGAYGAYCAYDPLAGSLTMMSHSDPDIARTIGVFARLRGAIEQTAWTAAEIERAVIACAREEETPIRPGMATDVALWRHVAGLTQERRRRWRQDQLAAIPEAVREAAIEVVRAAGPRWGTAVLSRHRRLRQAAAVLGRDIAIRPLAPRARGPWSGELCSPGR